MANATLYLHVRNREPKGSVLRGSFETHWLVIPRLGSVTSFKVCKVDSDSFEKRVIFGPILAEIPQLLRNFAPVFNGMHHELVITRLISDQMLI